MTFVNILLDGTQVEDMTDIVISRKNERLYQLIENVEPKCKESTSNKYEKEHD